MKIAFLTPSVSRVIGGIFEIERRLGQSLAEFPETEVSVDALLDEHTAADLALWHPLVPQLFPVAGPCAFGFSMQLNAAFLKKNADVAHLHSLWMFTSVVVQRWGQKKLRPYVVTPNGMLEPWALENSAWKKRIAGLLYERRMLKGAACIQANTEKEAADIRAYGLKNPIAIIPNGIDLPLQAESSDFRVEGSVFEHFAQGRKVLLYLGRIHPKKGLVNLLRAWKQTLNSQPSTNGWLLAIAGWDQGGHEAELKSLTTKLGLVWTDVRDQKSEISSQASDLRPRSSVLFLGPQFNEDKIACYQNCDAFILPSFSEGLPMVVLEAWAHARPVLMTPECNLPEGFTTNAAIRITTSTEGIAQGLNELFRIPPSALRSLGDNGRALVAARFTWPKVAAEMRSVYDWLLGSGPKPGCIV